MQIQKDMVWNKDAVIHLINNSNLATGKALWSLYERQTADEQSSERTVEHNGVGFNGRDAEFLSSVAKRLPSYGYTLSQRQLPHVRRKLVKYTRQLLEIIEAKGGKVDYTKRPKTADVQSTEIEQPKKAPSDRPPEFALF